MAERIIGPSFRNVAAGSTAVLELPKNYTYHRVSLVYAEDGDLADAATMANIERIRLKINGVIMWEVTAAEMLAINQFKGHTLVDGYLNLFMSNPKAATRQAKDQMALSLANVNTAQIEVDIAAGVTNPTLVPHFEARKLIRNIGPIRKFRRYTATAAGSGDLVYNTLPLDDGFEALYLFSSLVTGVKVRRDQDVIFEATAADLDDIYALYERTVPNNVFVVSNAPDHRLGDLIGTVVNGRNVTNFDLVITTSGAGNIPIIAEQIGVATR